MDSTKSPKVSKLPESSQDIISNLPSIATDKILKPLLLSMVAKMSVLSTQWRDKWVSHRYLVFDEAFWKGQGDKDERVNSIIINILRHHNGPLHKFHLVIPAYKGKSINLNQYLSFLSRTHIKKIALINLVSSGLSVPSHIFLCKELVKLRLESFFLNHPPSGFEGFACLSSLKLLSIEFKHDILGSLISSCPRLTLLWLEYCTGITHLSINAPNLEELVFVGAYAPLQFRNVDSLRCISLFLEPTKKNQALSDDTLNSIKLLATSCEIEELELADHMCKVTKTYIKSPIGSICKLLAAGGVTNSLSISFKHLADLLLENVDLGDLDVFSFTLGMIQSCPSIKILGIFVTVNKDAAPHKIDFDYSYKLDHLIDMAFLGITGSSAELQFLEYVLSISVMLEYLYFKCAKLDPTSELKVSRDLLRLQRASTNAQIVWLDKEFEYIEFFITAGNG